MRQPPPLDAQLEGHRHGDTVSEQMALELLARPDFVEDWVILPSIDGESLTLAWGDACTLEELIRVNAWNAAQMAGFKADRLPTGHA